MINKFKIGDRVKCVDARNWENVLTEEKVYHISKVISPHKVSLKEFGRYSFSNIRFELATPRYKKNLPDWF
jgi:hypothetical protein